VYSTDEAQSQFWTQFGDDTLDHLVDDALAANHDLRIALGRLVEARAARRESLFDLAPTVTASGGYTKEPSPRLRTSPCSVHYTVVRRRVRRLLGARFSSAVVRRASRRGAPSCRAPRRICTMPRCPSLPRSRVPTSSSAASRLSCRRATQRRQPDRILTTHAGAARCRPRNGAGYLAAQAQAECDPFDDRPARGGRGALDSPSRGADRPRSQCAW